MCIVALGSLQVYVWEKTGLPDVWVSQLLLWASTGIYLSGVFKRRGNKTSLSWTWVILSHWLKSPWNCSNRTEGDCGAKRGLLWPNESVLSESHHLRVILLSPFGGFSAWVKFCFLMAEILHWIVRCPKICVQFYIVTRFCFHFLI